MTENEREFIKIVNVDKAKNKTKSAIGFIVISLLTYVMPLIYGDFDFGIIFEIFSLTFLLIARYYMSKYEEIKAKGYVVGSIAAIGWILIYDMIQLCLYIKEIADLALLGYGFFIGEIFLLLYVILLFAIHKDLAKADNPIKYRESTDWFYETYEEKGENRNV